MSKKFFVLFVIMAIVLPLSFFGCKGKVEKTSENQLNEANQGATAQTADTLVTTEPAQTVATETIPPTATPQITVKPATVKADMSSRNKDVQAALKNAGFYAGSVDGKMGPKTKKAIEEFQKAKGLKADGKVGPKTWAELEKYLAQQQPQQ